MGGIARENQRAPTAGEISSLTVFFPAYNDSLSIPKLVRKTFDVVPRLTADFAVTVVNDGRGSKPRFADVARETLVLDPSDAANRITKKTRAILPVHLYGQVCDLAAFASLARGASISTIQDACQAHGVQFDGEPLTSFSKYAAYSFYPTKKASGA